MRRKVLREEKEDDKEIEDFMSNLRKEKNSKTLNITREVAKLSVDASNKYDQDKKNDQPQKKDNPKKNKAQKKTKTK